MNETYEKRIEKAKFVIQDAENILIGGGAVLSAAAGIEYGGKRFTENFAPFIKKKRYSEIHSVLKR